MTSKEALTNLFNEANRLSISTYRYTTCELSQFVEVIKKDLEDYETKKIY